MRTHSEPQKHSGHKKYIGSVVAIAILATTGIAGGRAIAGPNTAVASATAATTPDGPRLLDGAVGNLVVRLHGNVCSGTPITGTVYVVTAAHCVLTESGEVTQRTVVRNHVRYPAVAVLVDTRYHDHPSEALDAAVLIMPRAIPGPSVRVGAALPESGPVMLAGFQPLGADGSLLRDSRKDGPTALPYRPAGCVDPVESLDLSVARVMVPCGLVPGASGGGLFAEQDGELVLVGILSTVTADESANGVVPLASLQELLDHPDRYAHGFHTATGHDADRADAAEVTIRHNTCRSTEQDAEDCRP